MKLVVQSFNYAPHDLGGSERSARELAQGLSKRGHKVQVLLSDGSKPYPDSVDGLPIHILEGISLGKSPLWPGRTFLQRGGWNLRGEVDASLYMRARRYFLRERPDCVVINNPAGHGSALMLAARYSGVPYLPVIRDYGWFCMYGTMLRRGAPCENLCVACRSYSAMRRGLLSNTPCVAISEHIAQELRRYVGKPNVEVIPNSVSDQFILQERPTRCRDAKIAFGYLGRLHPSKGISETVDGWIASRVFEDGHRLLLAGDNQGINLPENPAEFGIQILGRQPAIEFLDQLDVLVVPSLWAEPFGRSVVEGLARGLYIVGSPRGAIPSLIPPGRGEVVASVTPSDMAAAFVRLCKDQSWRRELTLEDRHKDVLAYTREIMLDRYEAMIGRICS